MAIAWRTAVRFITELAWQQHFVRNMFIRPKSEAEIDDFVPDFTIINACKVTNPDYKVLRSTLAFLRGFRVPGRGKCCKLEEHRGVAVAKETALTSQLFPFPCRPTS